MSNINIATIMEFVSNFLKYENTNPSEAGVIYGGTLSGSRFDPLTFIKKPQVIFRLVALVSVPQPHFVHHNFVSTISP